jgi:hypothetical protein
LTLANFEANFFKLEFPLLLKVVIVLLVGFEFFHKGIMDEV